MVPTKLGKANKECVERMTNLLVVRSELCEWSPEPDVVEFILAAAIMDLAIVVFASDVVLEARTKMTGEYLKVIGA